MASWRSLSGILAAAWTVLGLSACGNAVPTARDGGAEAGLAEASAPDGSSAEASVNIECVAVPRTCAQVRASFASNAATVTIDCDDAQGYFTMHSTGVPNYTSNQTTPNAIRDQGWIVRFPLAPQCAASTRDVVNSRGELGFMVNGVPYYGPQDATGMDAVRVEGASFDDCLGHADQGCSYHYHEEPLCVFGPNDTAAQHREADGHPALLGYALDGFGVYASYGVGAGGALDGCSGHTDATRGYHYHATATAPYLQGCYRGTAQGQVMRTMNPCMQTPPPGDAGAGGDGATRPRACAQSSECGGACPPGSQSCVCAPLPMGNACVPSCTTSADCPMIPGMSLQCDAMLHVCHP